MAKKDRFACFIPVKPYVKRFLLVNFNAPDYKWSELVNLSVDRELQEAFKSRLVKDCNQWDKRYSELKRYAEQIAVEISKDDFYRYGWSLTPTDCVSFGQIVERRIKSIMYVFVDIRVAMGADISTAIREFMQEFGFSEYDWKYDSIRKTYYRHLSTQKKGDIPELKELMNKIVMGKLSEYGTISQQAFIKYEDTKI